jgi:hypothetical protein
VYGHPAECIVLAECIAILLGFLVTVILLNIILLSVIQLSVIQLSVLMPNILLLHVIFLSVILVNVTAPRERLSTYFLSSKIGFTFGIRN